MKKIIKFIIHIFKHEWVYDKGIFGDNTFRECLYCGKHQVKEKGEENFKNLYLGDNG
jgi:hypothetical protein